MVYTSRLWYTISVILIMNTIDLSSIGLETRDKRVYEALRGLENGSLRAIAEATGLNRGTVYEIIKKLTTLGLVSFTQIGERRHYTAAEPEVILSLINERRDQLRQLEDGATSYIRELMTAQQGKETSYFARFYEGDEGIATILRDVLQTTALLEKKEYRVISSRVVSSFIYNNFKSFSRQRIKRGIYARVIADSSSPDGAPLSERRQLLPSGNKLNGYVILYGGKTALISLGDANRLSGIIIDDPGVTTMQVMIFDQLWGLTSS